MFCYNLKSYITDSCVSVCMMKNKSRINRENFCLSFWDIKAIATKKVKQRNREYKSFTTTLYYLLLLVASSVYCLDLGV